MGTNFPDRMSVEETSRPRTRLPCHTTLRADIDEKQRHRQETKQTLKEKPYYSMELFSTNQRSTLVQVQIQYNLHVTSVHSESEADQVSSDLAVIERENHGAGVPRVYSEPPTNNDDYHRHILADAPQLHIKASVENSTMCTLTGNSEVCYTKECIQLLSSMDPPKPCMTLEITCTDPYAKTTSTSFNLVVTALDKEQKPLYKTTLKFSVKFNTSEPIKKASSEHNWQQPCSSRDVTRNKDKLEELLPLIKEKIQNFDRVIEFLCNRGILEESSTTSWKEPVGELLQYLLHQNGIKALIEALESTEEQNNLEIADLLKGI